MQARFWTTITMLSAALAAPSGCGGSQVEPGPLTTTATTSNGQGGAAGGHDSGGAAGAGGNGGAMTIAGMCPSTEVLAQVSGPEDADPNAQPDSELLEEVLAEGCPTTLYDGKTSFDGPAQLTDVATKSCHTELISCGLQEKPLACGRRALMRADYNQAIRQFRQVDVKEADGLDSNECAAVYGEYLAVLWRLGANWNNRFFSNPPYDAPGFDRAYHHKHMMRDINNPTSASDRPTNEYFRQFSCLNQRTYQTASPTVAPKSFARDTLLDELLATIWRHDHWAQGAEGAPRTPVPRR